jgi:hypothetical protein
LFGSGTKQELHFFTEYFKFITIRLTKRLAKLTFEKSFRTFRLNTATTFSAWQQKRILSLSQSFNIKVNLMYWQRTSTTLNPILQHIELKPLGSSSGKRTKNKDSNGLLEPISRDAKILAIF